MNLLEIVPSSTRLRGLILVAAAAALYVVLRLLGLHVLFGGDSEGIGALLGIIGTLYSVVYAFATYVIWGQFAAVENEILKESGALKDLIQFSRPLKENERDPMVRAVRAYARAVVESEWGILSRGEDVEHTDKLFSAVISSVTGAKPRDESERSVYERLLEIANQAEYPPPGAARAQREAHAANAASICHADGVYDDLPASSVSFSFTAIRDGRDGTRNHAFVPRSFRSHGFG